MHFSEKAFQRPKFRNDDMAIDDKIASNDDVWTGNNRTYIVFNFSNDSPEELYNIYISRQNSVRGVIRELFTDLILNAFLG